MHDIASILANVEPPTVRFNSLAEAIYHLAAFMPANKGATFRRAAGVLYRRYKAPHRMRTR